MWQSFFGITKGNYMQYTLMHEGKVVYYDEVKMVKEFVEPEKALKYLTDKAYEKVVFD